MQGTAHEIRNRLDPSHGCAVHRAGVARALAHVVVSVWTEHRVLAAVCGAYAVAVPLWLWWVDGLRFYRFPFSFARIPLNLIVFGVVSLVCLIASPWRTVVRRALPALITYVFIGLMFGTFTSAKNALSWVTPFNWDPTLAALDATLHGGDAWRLARWAYSRPLVLTWIDNAYFMWVITQLVVTYATAWGRPTTRRTRYLVTYVLLWSVVGTLLAATFGSGGPCFYTRFTGNDARYTAITTALAEHPTPLMAPRLQSRLWEAREMNTWTGPGTGITAMPSLHVAVTMLLVLLAWQSRRWALRMVALAYLLLIQAGSVILGWHYAVDGYVSIGLTAAIWWAVGLYLNRPTESLQNARMRRPGLDFAAAG